MGNSCMKSKIEPFVDLGWETWKELMHTFSFTEQEFQELYRPFASLRVDNSNKVQISALASYFSFAEDSHLIRCFSLFDKQNTGLMDFGEYFLCLWNYCTHSLETYLLFSYLVYDIEFSGRLTVGAVKQFLHAAYNSAEHSEAEHWEMLDNLIVGDGLGDAGIMDYNDFALMINNHYELFAWAFRLRPSFVEYFFDELFWAKKQATHIVLMIDTGNEIPLSTNTVLQFKAKGRRNFELVLEWARSRARTAYKNMIRKLSSHPNRTKLYSYGSNEVHGTQTTAIMSSFSRKSSYGIIDEFHSFPDEGNVVSRYSDRFDSGIDDRFRRLHSVDEENSVMIRSEKTIASAR